MVNVLSRWNWSPKAWPIVKIELTQVFNQQTCSALSYHSSVNYPPSSSSYRSPAPLIETPRKPHTHGSYASSMNISSPPKNYLQDKKVPAIPSSLSYSAAAKKAGDVPQVVILTLSVCANLSSLKEPSVRPRVVGMTLANRKKVESKKLAPACEKPSTTATKAGFYFNHSQVEKVMTKILIFHLSACPRSQVPSTKPGYFFHFLEHMWKGCGILGILLCRWWLGQCLVFLPTTFSTWSCARFFIREVESLPCSSTRWAFFPFLLMFDV